MRPAHVSLLFVTALVIGFPTLFATGQTAAPPSAASRASPGATQTQPPSTTTCLQVDMSLMAMKAEGCPAVSVAVTAPSATQTATTFSYRVGNGQWESVSPSDKKVRIENLAPNNHLVLFATGDCTKPQQCSPSGLMVQTAIPDPTTKAFQPSWHQLLRWDGDNKQLVISDLDDFFTSNPSLRVVINGRAVIDELHENQTLNDKKLEQKRKWAGKPLNPESDLAVEIYPVPDGCRDFFPDVKKARLDIINIPATLPTDQGPANGIFVGSPKIFDTFALKQKLATTASQLAAINPFSQAQITAQYGTLQGIVRDTSYLAAQVTTSPTPSIVTTTTAPTASNQITQNQANQPVTTVVATCPAGYYPTIITGSTAVSCAPETNPTAGSVTGTQTTTTQNPATNQSVLTLTGPTAQVQTTIPSLSGTVPTAPTPNPLTPPSNVGVSAADMLDEQTRLSAQLATLQMLLQGAVSDQLLLSHQRAYGVRAQTTVGFPISVETPRVYHGAVAEVRVLVLPHADQSTSQPITIVNLLPSEKTYNVAKVTSDNKAFGAGVAMQLVSFGLTTGKSKDRMYLAKDTDTVALQYPPAGHSPAEDFSDDSECADLPTRVKNHYAGYDFNSAVMFGWQFRPVLGADAVAAGLRTGFAQLAFPQPDVLAFSPEVWVQTRWRRYEQKKHLAGDVYQESCHWQKLNDPVSFINPVVLKDVQVTDEGQGMLRFHASGDLFSSTGQVRSGSLNVAPQYFDGYSLEYFEHATDVLANGDVELLDEAMHGYPMVIPTKSGPDHCRMTGVKLAALPMADGNSYMQLEYDRPNYKPDPHKDGPQHPLVLIGTDVYGLRDKPLSANINDPNALLDSACQPAGSGDSLSTHCTFSFFAPTDSIRSARNFLVRDPAWDSQGVVGTITIDPTFTKIEAASKPAKDDDADSDELPKKCLPKLTCKQLEKKQKQAKKDAAKPSWFLLSGTNLSALDNAQTLIDDAPANFCGFEVGCIQILTDEADGSSKHVPWTYVNVASNSEVWIKASKNITGVHVFWSRDGRPASEWDLAIKKDDKQAITADPAVLYETDSRAVTFKGADFSNVKEVYFEGKKLDLVDKPTKSKLIVQVTSAVTAKFGHKELTTQVPDDKDKTKMKTLALPIEVVKH